MTVRLNLVLSDELGREIDEAAEKTETNKSEILRKALQLYLAALEGKDRGLKIGLIDAASKEVRTEIVGI